MLLAVDVHYSEGKATVAGVLFRDWRDEVPRMELLTSLEVLAAYEPGKFYKRELPCILKLLEEHDLQPECIVIDGYVYLDGFRRPGLGRHLYDALGGKVAVIGVAKSAFKGIGKCFEVYRGASMRPLYITAAGIDLEKAKSLIRGMHGGWRVPTLLKRVDQLSRSRR